MARSAIFDILRHETVDANVLDMFAGSGSLGIEAFSRGARRCVFIERDCEARRLLDENLAHAGVAADAEVIEGDALACPARFRGMNGEMSPFTLVFVAPPYPLLADPDEQARLMDVLDELAESGFIAPVGRVVAQYEKPCAPPPETRFLRRLDERKYGRTLIGFYTLAKHG